MAGLGWGGSEGAWLAAPLDRLRVGMESRPFYRSFSPVVRAGCGGKDPEAAYGRGEGQGGSGRCGRTGSWSHGWSMWRAWLGGLCCLLLWPGHACGRAAAQGESHSQTPFADPRPYFVLRGVSICFHHLTPTIEPNGPHMNPARACPITSAPGVIEQYTRFVKPAFDTFIGPSRRFADIIVPWQSSENIVAIDLITEHIRLKLRQHDLIRIYRNLEVGPGIWLRARLCCRLP
jgi:hypothetical protein